MPETVFFATAASSWRTNRENKVLNIPYQADRKWLVVPNFLSFMIKGSWEKVLGFPVCGYQNYLTFSPSPPKLPTRPLAPKSP